MTLVLGLIASLGIVTAVAIATGLRLDAEHQVQATATFEVDLETLYARLSEIDRYALWRSDVSRIEWLGQRQTPTWVEHRPAGNYQLELVEHTPPTSREHRLVTTLGSHEGSWIFELSALPGTTSSRLTVTEKRRLANPALRAFYRYCMVPDSTMTQWLSDLRRSFNP